MNAQALRRSEYASIKQGAFVKIYFLLLIIPVLIYIIYFLFQKQTIIPPPRPKSPDYKNKTTPVLVLPCGVPVRNDPIIKVNNHKSYMVGSYIEHRHGAKMIHTIAIVLRNEDAQYQCLLCCNGKSESVPATCKIHSDHFGYEYGTADITCRLPVTCTKPTHVAITSPPVKEDGPSHDIYTFQQPVTNQEIVMPETFPYEFAVCISVMYEYKNVLELVQAMEMFKILGVQKVAIYKTSCDSNVQKVLDYYVKQNFVELIPWNLSPYINASRGWLKSVSSGQLHYFGQISALNDCVYRYMYQSRYVALQDLDELILPMNVKTWTELLPELERKYNHIGAFEFENNYFPLSIKDSNPRYSPDSWNNVPGVNILEHIVKMSNDPTKFNNFKVIIDPRFVYQVTVHGLLQSISGSVRVDSSIAHMYHMREISNEILDQKNQILDTRVRDYADSLIPAVSKVLQETLGSN
ncbi:uncharacterized protein LOC128527776 [Clarias gariepinus]|uniref:uncharacterized protein LOC128527776 n=1 Tax=Clarias gariepinus TaxID=13013 RepID=UPI00234CE68C|nr:uncharacterized protein LOC128527776 [Clarias gariepinus]